jgi:TPR repeat protein
VQTNRSLALEFFQKAAANGSLEASNKIAALVKP